MKYMNNMFVVVVEGILDPKDMPYKFDGFDMKYLRLTALITKINNLRIICDERLRHINFRSMRLMVKLNMVI
jgi:hypothetical protein